MIAVIVAVVLLIIPAPLFFIVRWRKRKNKEAQAMQVGGRSMNGTMNGWMDGCCCPAPPPTAASRAARQHSRSPLRTCTRTALTPPYPTPPLLQAAEAEAARLRMQSRIMRPGSKSFSLKQGGSSGSADIMVRWGGGGGTKRGGVGASWVEERSVFVTYGLPGLPDRPCGPASCAPQVRSGSIGGLAGYHNNGRLQSWSGSPDRTYGQYAISRQTSVTSMGSAMPVGWVWSSWATSVAVPAAAAVHCILKPGVRWAAQKALL